MLIGIAGTLGAGKGTVVECLKEKGFTHYSMSAKLKELLEAKGVTPNRDAYSELADEIRTKDPEGLVKLLWQQYEAEKPERAIIEALHDVGEADFVKSQGGVLLGVDADLQTRYDRISSRGSEKDNVTFEEFSRMALYEEEGGGKHNIRDVLLVVDAIIDNNGSLETLQQKVTHFLETHD